MSESADSSGTQDEKVPIVPAYVERRENCPRYAFSGGVWIVLADKARTAGNITNLESIYQSGGGLPRNIHQNEDEMAYVISGRLRIRIGDEPETTANPGALVFVPRGIARSFVADVDDTRVYHGFIPAGIESLVIQLGIRTDAFTVAIDSTPADAARASNFGVIFASD